jgi:prophage regulatory protein
MQQRILRLPQVLALTGLCRTNVYVLAAQGRFPKQIQLSQNGRCVGWLACEVEEYIRQRIESSRGEMRAAS